MSLERPGKWVQGERHVVRYGCHFVALHLRRFFHGKRLPKLEVMVWWMWLRDFSVTLPMLSY